MGEKIIVGPINKGLKTDREPFIIDNDSFPTLLNAYQWRGRIKRKRGTSFLNRLKRYFSSTVTSYNSGSTTVAVNAAGDANLLTGFSLQTNGNIVPGSVIILGSVGAVTYTDPTLDGYLTPTGTGGPNTINYATGVIHIPAQAGGTATAIFNYYPDLPVMGLEDLVLTSSPFPGTLAFDTKYSYTIINSSPYDIYDVSFYKNPVTATYLGYTQKTNITPTSWNGQDYQQFWTVNYQGVLWATNGIEIPFTTTSVGMQYKVIEATTVGVPATPSIINLQITAHGLVIGDFLFINEVPSGTTGINYQTGYVVAVPDANNVTVEFPNAFIAGNSVGGIAQYLTSRSDITKDCIRWYDGDPTDGNSTTPILNGRKGWVNFCPPLSNEIFSIADLPTAKYYLVGARLIWPYKDRLLFFGPVVQTSVAGSQVYLQDTIIFSQNGTPFYTASFTYPLSNSIFGILGNIIPILLPPNQTATPTAFLEDASGFGGNLSLGTQEPIVTVTSNEDVLLLGFTTQQARLVYTGTEIIPFNAFLIDSELGAGSTFSAINLNKGAVTFGSRGIVHTSQVGAQRIDIENPDQIFELNLTENGPQRVTAQRDYVSEWIYFTYPSNGSVYKFPNQTFLYNYRDQSWALFNECYTTYGQFRKQTGDTWATIGDRFSTWAEWNEPWNAGSTTLLQPEVIAGNQQGFVAFRDDGTTEDESLEITNLSFAATITGATVANPVVLTANNTFIVGQSVTVTGVVGMTQLNGNSYTISAVTPTTITIQVNGLAFSAYVSGGVATPPQIYSPNHCLNQGDYIIINGVLGTAGTGVNGKIFSVAYPPLDTTRATEFVLNPPPAAGTYFGGGLITRMYVPKIQTKQFPPSWGMSRKTRIGNQQFLLNNTNAGQIELQIFLSQDSSTQFNAGPVPPNNNVTNNALIYTDVLFTCPENPSISVDSVSLGFQGNGTATTLNLSLTYPLVAGSVIITIGSTASFTDNGTGGFAVTGTGVIAGSSVNYVTGAVVLVFTSAPVATLSSASYEYTAENVFSSTAVGQQQIWHRMNTSLLGDTVQLGFTMSDSQMRDTLFRNQFAEIELHAIVIDVSPSGVLA